MRLTVHTDYALRVLIYTGVKGEALSTIQEIAERFEISKNHLMKVVVQLGQKGYIETVRGRNGGIRLAIRPERINVGKVVRDCEEELDVVACLRGPGYCRIERHCILQRALGEATQGFLAALERYTLADLIRAGTPLGKRLAGDLALPGSGSAD